MASCNAYYCYLFRNLLGNSKYSSTEEAYNAWYDYVTSFGFGVKLDTDFPSEKSGFVPTAKTYNKIYGKGRWNYLSIISLSIGQGELGCTPLHLANLAANKKIKGEKHDYVKITLDIEGYRAKREETLRALARRMAAKVVKYKKSVMLEPMNPYERRIIHSEIQNIEGVSTNSIGSENNRKIVIYLEEK